MIAPLLVIRRTPFVSGGMRFHGNRGPATRTIVGLQVDSRTITNTFSVIVEFLREESSVDAATRRGEKAERVIMIRVVPHRRQILPLICRRLSVCVCSHVSVSRGVARYLQR